MDLEEFTQEDWSSHILPGKLLPHGSSKWAGQAAEGILSPEVLKPWPFWISTSFSPPGFGGSNSAKARVDLWIQPNSEAMTLWIRWLWRNAVWKTACHKPGISSWCLGGSKDQRLKASRFGQKTSKDIKMDKDGTDNKLWECKVWGWSSKCKTQVTKQIASSIRVCSFGFRVTEGEMEQIQNEHAAAMERLYSP